MTRPEVEYFPLTEIPAHPTTEPLTGLPSRFDPRHIADRPNARLANAWREGLIAWHKKQGTTLTKNQARALISQTRIGALYGQHYLTELPLHSLAALIAAAKATIAD